MVNHRKAWLGCVCIGLALLLAVVRPATASRAPASAAMAVDLTATLTTSPSVSSSPTASLAVTSTQTVTATATVTPTFNSASLLPQAKLLKLRLPVMGWLGAATREDWWALAVKPATWYYCEVDSQDFDPKMRVEMDGQVVTQSENVQPGTVKAAVSWTAGHETWAYVVISPAFRVGAYTLACSTGDPSPSTSGTPTAATATITPTPTVTPTPTLVPITWQTVASPTPTPALTQVVIKVYYDLNNSQTPDAAEGISGISLRVLDAAGRFVGWAITDDQGEARLTLTAPDVTQLYIPFLNWRQALTPGQLNTVLVRVEPVALPTVWPGP